MKKFYVASSFRNIDAVRYIASKLAAEGYAHTYDWTKNAKAREEQTATFEDLKEIGQKEMDAVMESDFIVVLLPGGKSTHVELGLALGLKKKIFLYSQDDAFSNIEKTSTFYHLPEVEKCGGTYDELLCKITASECIMR